MGEEAEAGIVSVTRIDLASGVTALGGAEELPVRRRGSAVAPDRGDRQRMVRIDDPGDE